MILLYATAVAHLPAGDGDTERVSSPLAAFISLHRPAQHMQAAASLQNLAISSAAVISTPYACRGGIARNCTQVAAPGS